MVRNKIVFIFVVETLFQVIVGGQIWFNDILWINDGFYSEITCSLYFHVGLI